MKNLAKSFTKALSILFLVIIVMDKHLRQCTEVVVVVYVFILDLFITI